MLRLLWRRMYLLLCILEVLFPIQYSEQTIRSQNTWLHIDLAHCYTYLVSIANASERYSATGSTWCCEESLSFDPKVAHNHIGELSNDCTHF